MSGKKVVNLQLDDALMQRLDALRAGTVRGVRNMSRNQLFDVMIEDFLTRNEDGKDPKRQEIEELKRKLAELEG